MKMMARSFLCPHFKSLIKICLANECDLRNVISPLINTCQDSSDSKACKCEHKSGVKCSIPVRGNFFAEFILLYYNSGINTRTIYFR